jgi:hypothetical protein
VEDILSRFGMSDCKPAKIPMDVNSNPSKKMSPKSKDDRAFMKDIPYQEVIGSLMYLVQCTRSDLSYAVGSLSRFNNDPGRQHWSAVKRVT